MKSVKASLIFAMCAAFTNTTFSESNVSRKCPFAYSSLKPSSSHFMKTTFQKIRFLFDNFGRYAAFMYVYIYVFPYIESISTNKHVTDGLKDMFKLYFGFLCSDKIKEHAKIVNSVFEYTVDSVNDFIEDALSSSTEHKDKTIIEESMQNA